MIIKNGEVFQEDGSFRLQDLYVENHRIVASEDEVTDKTIVDAAGLRVIPGLVDIHSHGAFGHDFSDADPEGLKIILKYEKSHGITSYCPTSMTLPAEELKEIFATIKTVGEMKDEAAVRGINMEGPFKITARCGQKRIKRGNRYGQQGTGEHCRYAVCHCYDGSGKIYFVAGEKAG